MNEPTTPPPEPRDLRPGDRLPTEGRLIVTTSLTAWEVENTDGTTSWVAFTTVFPPRPVSPLVSFR